MILTLDVGNTNIKSGLFEDGKLKHSWRMSSVRYRTSDEMGIMMESFFMHARRKPSEVDGIIISSVIPSMNFTIEHMCQLYFRRAEVMFVGPGIKTGMNIRYENPKELGSDRICNAVAAYRLYGGPVLTVDFGTATTFGVVSEKGDFLGGAICPGIFISLDALTERTAKLPRVELIKPKSVIGRNTANCIQAGVVYGYVGQVDYIINKIQMELNEPDIKVVATGGLSRFIAEYSHYDIILNSTLTLEGLHMIYCLNTAQQ
ncbi:MAG: type III pantothenate kinase [Christensenellales bacterium]|jgi:type III pantothenate kinase